MSKWKVLFLETQLDDDIRSRRTQTEFLHHFFISLKHRVDFVPRQVHSRADLEIFLKEARRHRFDVVHFSGHGKANGHAAKLFLGPRRDDYINLGDEEDRRLFHHLTDKVLVFSSCEVGKAAEAMTALQQESGAGAILGYTREVDDPRTYLIEPMFYQLLPNLGEKAHGRKKEFRDISWDEIDRRLRTVAHALGLTTSARREQSLVRLYY